MASKGMEVVATVKEVAVGKYLRQNCVVVVVTKVVVVQAVYIN